jgi:hypothetical protein
MSTHTTPFAAGWNYGSSLLKCTNLAALCPGGRTVSCCQSIARLIPIIHAPHANGGRAQKGTPAALLVLPRFYAVAMTAVFS